MKDRRRQLGAGAAERMPECNRTAVDVESIRMDRQRMEAREHLGRERFVELDEIDLIERQAGELQRLLDRGHRTDAEPFRLDAGRGEGDEAGDWRQAAL